MKQPVGASRNRSEFLIAPDGAGTDLTMTFEGRPSGWGGKLLAATLGRLFAGPVRKALLADLDDIAEASEHGS